MAAYSRANRSFRRFPLTKASVSGFLDIVVGAIRLAPGEGGFVSIPDLNSICYT